ncbi:FadR/GntR family transcriptional regulator [Dactylosporangium sp. CS-033363]|uniref:FadR/GntR family transcriptional regulator n=1 Tax=Dactylosporangium sp. CS-033363 TaxID=3239935 RepID=UPI003D8BD703
MADVRGQLRQPKLGEMVAGVIRQRILDGEWRDGELLPNQDAIVAEFGVSRPSIREAMRILEAEGLITVRRGNVGGAVVHRPEARHVAYAIALVLESRGVTLDDVGVAMGQLEATSAGLCAARRDRARKVVPQLRRCNASAKKAIDEPMEFVRYTSEFHSSLVELSGNETMRVLAGSLESLWLVDVNQWAEKVSRSGSFPDRDHRLKNHEQHVQIVEAIADGDVPLAVRLTESHFDPARFHLRPEDAGRRVDASAMHGQGGPASPGLPA